MHLFSNVPPKSSSAIFRIGGKMEVAFEGIKYVTADFNELFILTWWDVIFFADFVNCPENKFWVKKDS